MNAAEECQQIVAIYEAEGITATGYNPEVVRAGEATVWPSADFLTSDGATFGCMRTTWDIEMRFDTAGQSNEDQTKAVLDYVVKMLAALTREGFGIGNVSAPYMQVANTTQFLSIDLTVRGEISIGE